ncbi:MAG: hypothetical protein ACR650_16660 [Methylocystis sp.]
MKDVVKGKTTKERQKATPDQEASSRVDVLFEEAAKFCAAVGLHKELVHEIYEAENDWTFILKIDALLETATKEIIKSGLKLKVLNRFVGAEALREFVDGLSMNGKTSVLHLLKASGCPDEDLRFVEAVRRVRNAYAHNIKLADLSLIELIKQRPEHDKSHIVKNISNIKTYNEADLIASFEKDGKFLRFCILDATLRMLFHAYHLALK